MNRDTCTLTRPRKSDINTVRAGGGREVEAMKAVRFHEFGGSDVLQARGDRRPEARPGRGLDQDPGGGPQPPRRRRPGGRFPLPGRAAAHARGRGRRRDREGRQGRRRLEARRPRQPVHHGDVRRVPLLPHRPRVALPDAALHQLRVRRRLRRAGYVLGARSSSASRRASLRGGCGAAGRLRHLLAHALHAREAPAGRDGPHQLGRERHRFCRRAAREAGRCVRHRQRVERREARPRARSWAWTSASTTGPRTSSRRSCA